MSELVLVAEPLTTEVFAPFGDVIEAFESATFSMNDARFERFDDLANVEVDSADGGRVAISIVECKTPVSLPHRFNLIERHPLGSQAFIPLNGFVFTVVVAPLGDQVDAGDLRAFRSNGSQGINYHRGTWHMPLISEQTGQQFLVVDRVPGTNNYEEIILDQFVSLR